MEVEPLLPEPAYYFPPKQGRYEVSPGLFRLGTNFGNGAADTHLFQIDREFSRYRANKLACRAERFSKYVCKADCAPRLTAAAARLMRMRLAAEYPALFIRQEKPEGGHTLNCTLTGETLVFDSAMNLTEAAGEAYADAFDALCCQVPEDIALVQRTPDGGDYIAALHLCAPSQWAAEEKIGKSFVATHVPVPHFEKVSAAAGPLQERVMERGPFVRFTWGIEFNDRLNQHPEPPPDISAAETKRRIFDAKSPVPFWFRVERQVLWSLLPEADAYLFTIRVYTSLAVALPAEQRHLLAAAIRSMSPESLRYKSLTDTADKVVKWLESEPRNF
jgi:hypothetical protein